MGKPPRPARVGRRAFLRIAGVAAGALATPPIFTTSASSATIAPSASGANHQPVASGALRVGVLLPQSQLYPAAAANFRAGMDLHLSQANPANRPISLVARDYGATPSVALEQDRQLIAGEQVDLIVGSFSSSVAAALHPLLSERQTPLLISSIGANLTSDDRQSPYIIRNSFSYWQSSWALGRWVAGSIGKQAFVASSFYDSGYDSLYAFQLGFESAGGVVQATKVTHIPAGVGNLHVLMADIRRAQPDLVFGAYSGSQASDFVRAYASSGLSLSLS